MAILRLISKRGIRLLMLIVVTALAVGLIPMLVAFGRAPQQNVPTNLDLAMSKNHVGDLQIGVPAVFTLVVTNVGSEAVTGPVTVSDNLPAGLTPVQVAGGGWSPCGFTGQLITCVYSNTATIPATSVLPPIILVASVSQAAAPTIVNSAVLSNASDANTTNNTASDTATVTSADLAVSKRVSKSIPAEGETIDYSLRLVNIGPSATSGVVLTDTLPTGVTFTGAVPTKGLYDSASGRWTMDTLTVGEAVTLTLSAVVSPGTRGTQINNATNGLKSNLYDYNSANNTATVGLRVLSTRLIGRVSDQITTQPVVTATVVITDSLNHVYTTATAASGWYTFTDTTAAPIAAGNVAMRVTKKGYRTATFTPVLTVNTDTRQDVQLATTDLHVSMVDGKTTVVPGEIFTYTVVVSNTGTIPASSVVISDVLPTYLTYIADTLGITHTGTTTGTITWKLKADLAARDTSISNQTTHKQEFKLRVRVAYALPANNTSLKNSITVRTASPEAVTTNNKAEDTNTNNSSSVPTLTITNAVTPATVRTGQNATYTIRVSNTGPGSISEARVSDTFSTLLDIVSATTTKGTRTINSTTRAVSVDIGVLAKNETVTITVVGRVNSSATVNQTVSNTASLSYKYNAQVSTRTSTAVSFALQVSSTLPGTGGIELPGRIVPGRLPLAAPRTSPAALLAFFSAALLALLALGALALGLRSRKQASDWAGWYLRTALMLGGAALLFGAGSIWLGRLNRQTQNFASLNPAIQASAGLQTGAQQVVKQPQLVFEEEPIIMPLFPVNEPAKLPDFPIPTPAPQVDSGPPKDTSPVNRIVLSAIGLDTEVKYVPFDGLTWLIAGLKQEIAWMGDTSWPGLGGNTALAGHVTLANGTDGPFRYLELIQQGDQVSVFTEVNQYIYRVREKRVVEDTDFTILSQSTEAQLTLITCAEFDPGTGFYSRRLVIFADLVETQRLETAKNSN